MCNPKSQGGKRCDAEHHPRAGSHLVAAEVMRHSDLTREQGLRVITQVKRAEAARLGVRPVVDAASDEAIEDFIKQEKGKTIKNENLNLGHRYRIADRWDYVAQGRIPTALLAAWQRVLSWARSGLFRSVGAGVLVAGLVAGCTAGSPVEPGEVPTPTQTQTQTAEPSETEAPVEEPGEVVDNDTSFALHPASVEVPQDVVDAYGADAAINLVPDALAVASLANEAQELHHARAGDEMQYWSVYREQVSPELYERIQENVAAYVAGDAEAGHRLNGLAPFTHRDGTLATIDGVTHSAGERGIEVKVTNTPTVFLTESGRVAIDLPQEARAYTDDGHVLKFTMNKVLEMTPSSDGRWVLDTYAPRNISAISVEAA